MSTINIFQKNWAFTSSDAEEKQIQTGSFGPCYVVTFTSGKFAAMAHIDDNTIVDSVSAVFDKFRENSVNFNDVKVIILGGWKEHAESFKWGKEIVKKINEAGFVNVSTKNMYTKSALTILQQMRGILPSDGATHYHWGAIVDSTNGKTFILKEVVPSFEAEQLKKTQEFAAQHPFALDTEVPLTQIIA